MPPDDSWLLHRHRIGNKPHALACNVTSSSNLAGGIDTPRGCPCPTWTIKRCVAGAGRKEAVRVAINAHKATNDLPPRIDAIGCRRSEEHTSELQSRLHLVCRLLLEKKK